MGIEKKNTTPGIDEETSDLWKEGVEEFEKKGGYFQNFKPSKEMVAQVREDMRVDNLLENFYLWIDDSFGQFDTKQLYADLGVRDSRDKTLLRVTLHNLVKKKFLERGRMNGIFRKIDYVADSIEPSDREPVPLPINLPGNIEDLVNIYPGNIIINAGSPNSGKTAYDLNVALENRDKFKVIYFSSEMGQEELTLRASKFDIPHDEWSKIKFRRRSEDFQDIIEPDALNIIDYLEPIEGEFFKIGDNIRKIFQKLDRGIALVSLQMDKGGQFAWGGQKTTAQARLYITLDNNELKIVKGKNYASTTNPNDLVRPFKLVKGCNFIWEPWRMKGKGS